MRDVKKVLGNNVTSTHPPILHVANNRDHAGIFPRDPPRLLDHNDTWASNIRNDNMHLNMQVLFKFDCCL